ncbi:unnamed protein product [Durusdinium trenchii]|uniref:Uncharacterized protein n=1 Tax=Durusdinium trenchii TaxID=1381693 RepID=A0ABP0L4G8_9DINO
MARRRSLPVQYHVSEAGEEVFDRVVRFIQLHGFCCVETRLVKEKESLNAAVAEVRKLEASLEATPEIVLDGLLGEDGSARTLALEKHPEALQPTDQVLSDYAAGLMKSPSALDMGLQKLERTPSLLHEAGAPEEDPPAMSEVEAQAWLPIFLRHQIMLILFLGPSRGTLELQPFDEDGHPMRLRTEPGMLVALQANGVWRRPHLGMDQHSMVQPRT